MCKGPLLGPCFSLDKLISGFFIVFSITSLNGNEYPNWFLYPSEFPKHFVVFNYDSPADTNIASERYCFYDSTTVKGNYYRYNKLDEQISEYYWEYSTKCMDNIRDYLLFCTSYTGNVLTNSKFELFTAINSNIVLIDKNDKHTEFSVVDLIQLRDKIDNTDYSIKIETNDIETPEWINNVDFWEEDNYYYAYGMYSSHGEMNDAWIQAEEKAFFILVTTPGVLVASASIYNDLESGGVIYDSREEVVGMKLNHTLIEGKVMERWPDIQNSIYYVLVRVQKNNIIINYN